MKVSLHFDVCVCVRERRLTSTPPSPQVIIEVTEMLHNASLLIDDIEDSSTLRRGFPVAHSIYGVPSVINSANYVYFLGLEKVLTLEHPEAVRVFTRQLLELHRGQGLDIHWRDTYTCPSEQEYRAMVLQKTGGLFGLAVGLMQLFSSWGRDLKPLLDTLALYSNPWRCDCAMAWFLGWSRAHPGGITLWWTLCFLLGVF
jgi:geranylgeranyl pyrophosphate synthase